MQHVAGLQRLLAVHAVQVALDLAEVLGAGHDFLAGVAPLVETDATHFFEIGHLRHEFFLGGQRHQGEGRLDVEPAPDGDTGRPGLDGELLPQRSHGRLRGDDDQPPGVQAQHRDAIGHGCLQHFGRAGQAGFGQCLGRLRAGQAEHDGAVGQGVELDLGAQHEHLQALLRRFLQIGGEPEHIAALLLPDQEAGLHAALGVAPAGMLRLALGQMIDIVGELAVQKGLGILAAGLDQGQVGQRYDHGILPGGLQFAGGIAKVEKFGGIAVEGSFGRFQKAAPVGIHGGSCRGFGYYIARYNVPFPERQALSCPSTPLRLLIKFFLALLFLLALAAAGIFWWASQPLALRTSPLDFHVAAGSTLRSAIGEMRAAGIRVEPTLLTVLARFNRADTGIKAGSYAVSEGITPMQLLDKLLKGKVTQGELVLVEGWTFRQWRKRLDAHADLKHDAQGLSEAQIAERLGLGVSSLEGQLFPDTYLFDKKSSDLDLLARAHRAMQRKLDEEWAQRPNGLPYKTPQEALIMASIVEKETGREADRSTVAAVFVNRLRIGMPLQTDPSVIYGLGEAFDGNLRKRDLQSDTPYNTYTRPGLPPTPIAMPGLASLRAALNPAQSDALYFVARGDGSSEFSRTLDEHNQAVSRYQRRGK